MPKSEEIMTNMTIIVLNESAPPRQSQCDVPAADWTGAVPAARMALCRTAGDDTIVCVYFAVPLMQVENNV